MIFRGTRKFFTPREAWRQANHLRRYTERLLRSQFPSMPTQKKLHELDRETIRVWILIAYHVHATKGGREV